MRRQGCNMTPDIFGGATFLFVKNAYCSISSLRYSLFWPLFLITRQVAFEHCFPLVVRLETP